MQSLKKSDITGIEKEKNPRHSFGKKLLFRLLLHDEIHKVMDTHMLKNELSNNPHNGTNSPLHLA